MSKSGNHFLVSHRVHDADIVHKPLVVVSDGFRLEGDDTMTSHKSVDDLIHSIPNVDLTITFNSAVSGGVVGRIRALVCSVSLFEIGLFVWRFFVMFRAVDSLVIV